MKNVTSTLQNDLWVSFFLAEASQFISQLRWTSFFMALLNQKGPSNETRGSREPESFTWFDKLHLISCKSKHVFSWIKIPNSSFAQNTLGNNHTNFH